MRVAMPLHRRLNVAVIRTVLASVDVVRTTVPNVAVRTTVPANVSVIRTAAPLPYLLLRQPHPAAAIGARAQARMCHLRRRRQFPRLAPLMDVVLLATLPRRAAVARTVRPKVGVSQK
jgi:hypothetical protein